MAQHTPYSRDDSVPSESEDEAFEGLNLSGMSPLQNPIVCCGSCCCLVFVLLGLLSIGSVPPLNYGIKYNNFNKAADIHDIKLPGRYFILPWNSFLLFPSNVRSIEFNSNYYSLMDHGGVHHESLQTRTTEVITIVLQVSLQYQLKRETLGQTYSTLNLNYQDYFASQARDALLKAASKYPAQKLWKERDAFADSLKDVVEHEWVNQGTKFAACWGLQLLQIDLKDSYENTIVGTQVQEQKKYMRTQEQVATQIRAQTEVFHAEYDRQIKVIMAQGNANYTVVTKSASAEAQWNSLAIEKTVFQALHKQLGVSGQNLVDYQRYAAIGDLAEAEVFYGFGGSEAMVGMKR
jgi:regulator of protease activity HflC (stomatin/prohibitin superfamily)